MALSDIEVTCIIDPKMRIINTELSTSIAMLGKPLNINAVYEIFLRKYHNFVPRPLVASLVESVIKPIINPLLDPFMEF